MQKALEAVVLHKVDCEKGEGPELSKKFRVQGYPTYVLATSGGETLERWSGYEKSSFLTMTEDAFSDLTTIEQKKKRFHASPTARDADKLARYHDTVGEYADAIALYGKAAELDPDGDRAEEVFDATYSGFRDDVYSVEDLARAGQAVLAREDRPGNVLYAVFVTMSRAERKAERPGLATPFLKRALEAAEADPAGETAAAKLRVEYALRVDKDPDKAYTLKLATLTEGWKDDAEQLNAVAWWCFENSAKLAEAEELARRGVELAAAGSERARVLDTLAEVCNARGNCPEAITLIRRAVEDDPTNDYYKKQLARFEEQAAGTN